MGVSTIKPVTCRNSFFNNLLMGLLVLINCQSDEPTFLCNNCLSRSASPLGHVRVVEVETLVRFDESTKDRLLCQK